MSSLPRRHTPRSARWSHSHSSIISSHTYRPPWLLSHVTTESRSCQVLSGGRCLIWTYLKILWGILRTLHLSRVNNRYSVKSTLDSCTFDRNRSPPFIHRRELHLHLTKWMTWRRMESMGSVTEGVTTQSPLRRWFTLGLSEMEDDRIQKWFSVKMRESVCVWEWEWEWAYLTSEWLTSSAQRHIWVNWWNVGNGESSDGIRSIPSHSTLCLSLSLSFSLLSFLSLLLQRERQGGGGHVTAFFWLVVLFECRLLRQTPHHLWPPVGVTVVYISDVGSRLSVDCGVCLQKVDGVIHRWGDVFREILDASFEFPMFKTLHFAETRIGINGHVLMQMEPWTDGHLFQLGESDEQFEYAFDF